MYLGQLCESFFSSELSLLSNQLVKKEAFALLNSYKKLQPMVTFTIKNFHHVMKEVKRIKVVKAEAEARNLRTDYANKLQKTKAKIANNLQGPDLSRYQEQEKMLNKFLDSDLGKDREVEESEFV